MEYIYLYPQAACTKVNTILRVNPLKMIVTDVYVLTVRHPAPGEAV